MDEGDIRRALVVVAHPDDAEFGCAGTVAVWARRACEVFYLVCTKGQKGTSDPAMSPERLATIREREQRAAAAVLGVREVSFLDHMDGEVRESLDLRRDITRAIRLYKPDAVLTHDPTVLFVNNEFINHPDHRAVGQATVDAIYPTARDRLQFPEHLAQGLEPHKVTNLYVFGTDRPNYWTDIGAAIDLKINALREHKSQVGGWDGLAERIRDRSAQQAQGSGFEHAEAFRRIAMRR